MAQGTSAAQVQAYRFGTRRLAHALEHGSAELVPFAGPRRGLSLLIGAILAGLVLAGFAVYGIIKPAPAVGDAKVLVDADQGGAFVVRDGVVHPALNIASAMLAAVDSNGGGANGTVRQVNSATLGSMPRGETVGILDAPNQVPAESALVPSSWLVCDDAAPDPAAAPGTALHPRTTVILGRPLVGSTPGPSMLVTTDGKTHYLLWAGHRSKVGAGPDDKVASTLGLQLRNARTVSLAFLNSVPEQPALVAPTVPGAGTATSVGGVSAKVGDIVRADTSSGDGQLLLVLRDGLQPVSPVFADLARAGTGQGAIATLTPGQVAAAGISPNPLGTDRYPQNRPAVVDVAAEPVLCSGWATAGGTITQTLAPAAALPLPAKARPVPVPPTTRDHGAVADQVYVEPGHGIVVNQSVDGRGQGTENLLLVTDQGVRYPVVSPGALAGLGLGKTVVPAPSHLLGLLPLGPSLDPAAARTFVADQPGVQG